MLDWEYAFRHSPVPVFIVERDHKIVARSNSADEEWQGNAPANLEDLVSSQFVPEIECWLRDMRNGDTATATSVVFTCSVSPGIRRRIHARAAEMANGYLVVTAETIEDVDLTPDLRLEAVGLVSRYVVHETNNACGGALLATENGLASLHDDSSGDLLRESLEQIGEAMQACGRMSHELLAFGRDEHSWRSDWSLHELARRSVMLAAKLAPAGSPRPHLELLETDGTVHLNGLEIIFSISQLLVALMGLSHTAAPCTLAQFEDGGTYGFVLRGTGPGTADANSSETPGKYHSLARDLLSKNDVLGLTTLGKANNRYSRISFLGER